MRLHTKEKPFKCDLCGQPFAVKSNLTRHMRSHTGEKRFSCVMCNKLFSRNSNMKYHMRTHTVNPKKYRNRKWRGEEYHRWLQIFLAMRSNWHGRKPATCSLCSQILSQSVTLKCHMLASPQKPCSKQPVQNHNSDKRDIFSPQTNSFHKHIGKRNHSGVLCATNHFLIIVTWRDICVFTVVRGHSNVSFATGYLHKVMTWRFLCTLK